MLKFPGLLLSQDPRSEGGNKNDKKSKKNHENENPEFTRFFYQIHATQPVEKTSNHKFITFIKTFKVSIKSQKWKKILKSLNCIYFKRIF